MSELEHLVMKVREAAAGGTGAMSTGEALAAALALNRSDWLAAMGYTIAQALDRIGREWVALIPSVAKMIADADSVMVDVKTAAQNEVALADISSSTEEVDACATLVTYGQAPGYRDASFTFDLQRPGAPTSHRVCLRISPEDGESVAKHILDTHRLAWRDGNPIDIRTGERRPRWIDKP